MYKYFLISFILCLILTPLIRQMVTAQNLVAIPSKDRWHKKTTALYGGVAIYLSLAFPLLFTSEFTNLPQYSLHSSNPFFSEYSNIFLWFCMTWFFFLGLWDDLRNLSPHIKLAGQIIGAAAFAFAGFRLNWFSSLTIDTMVTMVWIVGIVNAFNLIDNMDGLCAGTGLITALFFVLLLSGGTVTAICLAGALAGFLIYNFNPASIFMGDCGSMLIGFVLAATSINYSGTSSGEFAGLVLVPGIILSVPILDTIIVTIVRLLSGRKASVGGKDHTSHRLVVMGFSEREAVLILYGVSLMAGITAFFVTKNDSFTAPAIVVPFTLTVLLVGIYIAQIRIYREKEFSVLRGKKIHRILTTLAFKWQTFFVVLDFFLISFSYYLAYRIRFDNPDFLIFFKVFLSSLPVVIICKYAAFVYLDIYKILWRHIGLSDLLDYLKAALAGSILSIVSVTYVFRFESFSKGVFIIDFFLTLGLLIMVRGSLKLFTYISSKKQLKGLRVMIYGAGRCGELFIREIMANPELDLNPVGFIDKDPGKKGKKIYGFKVLGSLNDLSELAESNDIAGIIVSIKQIETEELDKLNKLCTQKGLFLKRFGLSVSDLNL
jgi:UDP-GlcNAc:undecaprenyl-phosphate/decaprenyl-phosphate GlcNAc-1-phosphate transferase